MGFLGLDLKKTSNSNRKKRLIAFIIDAVIVLLLIYIAFMAIGAPDFLAVQKAMNAVKSASSVVDTQKLNGEVFALFNAAYWKSLLIWFIYEAAAQIIFKGSTVGKLIMGLRIVPVNPNRNLIVHHLLMVVRSAIKCLFLYLFQGFPFLISTLTIFANKEERSGFDIFVKTRVKNIKE